MSDLTRRSFILSTSAGPDGSIGKGRRTVGIVDCGQAVDRIRQQVGIPWRAQTVDQIVARDESSLFTESPLR